jgi:hypothetical protein
MQEKGFLVDQYSRKKVTDVGQMKYNGTQTGAAVALYQVQLDYVIGLILELHSFSPRMQLLCR